MRLLILVVASLLIAPSIRAHASQPASSGAITTIGLPEDILKHILSVSNSSDLASLLQLTKSLSQEALMYFPWTSKLLMQYIEASFPFISEKGDKNTPASEEAIAAANRSIGVIRAALASKQFTSNASELCSLVNYVTESVSSLGDRIATLMAPLFDEEADAKPKESEFVSTWSGEVFRTVEEQCKRTVGIDQCEAYASLVLLADDAEESLRLVHDGKFRLDKFLESTQGVVGGKAFLVFAVLDAFKVAKAILLDKTITIEFGDGEEASFFILMNQFEIVELMLKHPNATASLKQTVKEVVGISPAAALALSSVLDME